MDEKQLKNFIDIQKRSSWLSVETKTVKGRIVREAFPAPRVNYENFVNKLIDKNRIIKSGAK